MSDSPLSATELAEIAKRAEDATPSVKPSDMRFAAASIKCEELANCGNCVLCKAADLLTDGAFELELLSEVRSDIPRPPEAIAELIKRLRGKPRSPAPAWDAFEGLVNLETVYREERDEAAAALESQAERIAELEGQNQQMRATLIAIEPRCEYVGCEKPGPHVTHSITGTASAALEGTQ
jgi:hypothetical protein